MLEPERTARALHVAHALVPPLRFLLQRTLHDLVDAERREDAVHVGVGGIAGHRAVAVAQHHADAVAAAVGDEPRVDLQGL